jgi:UrcA family protein
MTRTFALAALLGLMTITPAAAEEQKWEIGSTFLIRGSGLDLATSDGRERLLRRVERAGVQICRDERPKIAFERCTSAARDKALATAPTRLKVSLEAALAARQETLMAAR